MADFDKQKIATELRKFRKKLRQIEKLEEQERELTEEEYRKLCTKDEVRSKVQQLVSREVELNAEIQKMENQPKEDEPNLFIQQEI
ncbi:uncharacterized protein LOC111336050 [Stylophora pistillata]|uniref:Uncharacterized protein n=1 Tax=Stylophora pistillata TaxID=50429 RepID=A0A2B4RXY4_STYPI|nr:uncharacterized protein LOC111336050 [Stylophora pistillata]PFX21112.1 hypothetical protein AWC38_SpisGene14412 [Stylophora pistillata]